MTRQLALVRGMRETRDLAGNIISNEPSDCRTYTCDTGSMPSERFERLIAMLAIDFRHALMVFHQLIQGK